MSWLVSLAANAPGGLSILRASSSFNCDERSAESPCLLQGKPFEEMAQDKQCPLHGLLDTPTEYSIHIQRKGYHWFLLVGITTESDPSRPTCTMKLVSLEITTPDLSTFCRIMDVLQDDEGKELVGSYKGTLMELCKMADKVVDDMGRYSLFSNNCQHFCNNLLSRLGLETFPPTVGPETTVACAEGVPEFDRFDYLVDHMNLRMASTVATVMNAVLRAPPGPPPANRTP